MHASMSPHIEQAASKAGILENLSLDEHWHFVSDTCVEAFCGFFRLSVVDRNMFRCKGKVSIKEDLPVRGPKLHKAAQCTTTATHSAKANHLLAMSRKAQSICDRIKVMGKGNPSKQQLATFYSLNAATASKAHYKLRNPPVKTDFDEEASLVFKHFVTTHGRGMRHNFDIVKLRKVAADHYKSFLKVSAEDKKEWKEQTSSSLRRSMKKAYQATKVTLTAPLTFLKRKCIDKAVCPNELFITDRREMDKHIIDQWHELRQGNVTGGDLGVQKWIQNFLNKYGRFVFYGEEHQLNDITPERLREECKRANDSAPSLDDWHTAEFALLPLAGFRMLAELMNRIEKEGVWPSDLAIARAVFLHKDDPSEAGPLDLRPLLILPTFYRRWASMRLKDCEGWVQTWQVIESFSEAPGLSAEDAAYSTAVVQEYHEVTNQDYCGAVADILKCFDQILRPLLEML